MMPNARGHGPSKRSFASKGRSPKALRAAIELKNCEYNAHGVELNQCYTSNAVTAASSDAAPGFTRDAELFYQPTSHPGAELPYVWLE